MLAKFNIAYLAIFRMTIFLLLLSVDELFNRKEEYSKKELQTHIKRMKELSKEFKL